MSKKLYKPYKFCDIICNWKKCGFFLESISSPFLLDRLLSIFSVKTENADFTWASLKVIQSRQLHKKTLVTQKAFSPLFVQKRSTNDILDQTMD